MPNCNLSEQVKSTGITILVVASIYTCRIHLKLAIILRIPQNLVYHQIDPHYSSCHCLHTRHDAPSRVLHYNKHTCTHNEGTAALIIIIFEGGND